MSGRRPLSHEPIPALAPLERLRPVQPELPETLDLSVHPPEDVVRLPAPESGEEPI
jgi:hypothetical protein